MLSNSYIYQVDEVAEEEEFFDSKEEISSFSDSCPESPSSSTAADESLFKVWTSSPDNIRERRASFMRCVGLDTLRVLANPDVARMTSDGGAVLGSSVLEDSYSASACSAGRPCTSDGSPSRESFEFKIKNSDDDGSKFVVDDTLRDLREVGSDRSSTPDEFHRNSCPSSFAQKLKQREDGKARNVNKVGRSGKIGWLRRLGAVACVVDRQEEEIHSSATAPDESTSSRSRRVKVHRCKKPDEFHRNSCPSSFAQKLKQREDGKARNVNKVGRSGKIGWLRRLGAVACVVDRQEEEIHSSATAPDESTSSRSRRVKVHRCKKQSKELSAVYKEQDINAHDGAILTMKFSPDGEFLASGGEDGVVRVWRVIECEREEEGAALEYDPSCIYFTVNNNSELAPLYAAEKKKVKSRSMRRTPDSACVVVPPEVFRISEEPLHEFRGHDGDVLDLSWSDDKYLLSSSTDKTVRLWRVGCDSCLNAFVHNNYVTCVQFNPINKNYFVSGSIDGKIRIWELSQRRVVDWTDVKDLVTAVCYHPDGKGVVVGSMTGECLFYDVSENVLELKDQISLQGKKKSSDKRITGFEYCPSDHRKLMVTSADSQVRILDGVDVVSKFKGLHNAGSQISASFTSDGRHIVSASEDSNVCVWAHDADDSSISNRVRTSNSCEQFISTHASVAIPWHCQKASRSSAPELMQENCGNNTVYLSPAGSFTLSNALFSEFLLPKGSATWPEEKLSSTAPSTAAALPRSQYKFLKTSFRNSSHAWGQVIVTAGWDGRIRTFQNYGLPVNR